MTLPGQRQASRPAPPGGQRRGRACAGGHLRLLTGGGPASSGTEQVEEHIVERGADESGAGPADLVVHAAGTPQVDREVLTVALHGPADRPASEPLPERWPELRRVSWTELGREEWALTLLPSRADVDDPRLVANQVRSLQPYSRRSALGRKAVIVRVPAGKLDPRLGAAVVHHRRGGPVVYCDAAQITATAADTLATLAVPVAEFAAQTGGHRAFQLSLVRVRHRDVPSAAHPVVIDAIRGGQVTGYMCARVITAGLAEVLGMLGTAYAWHRVHAQVSGAGGAAGF